MDRPTCNTFLREIIIFHFTTDCCCIIATRVHVSFRVSFFHSLWSSDGRPGRYGEHYLELHHFLHITDIPRQAASEVVTGWLWRQYGLFIPNQEIEMTESSLQMNWAREERLGRTRLSVSVCSGEPAACLPGENSAFVWHPDTQPVWSRVSAASRLGSNIRACQRVRCDGEEKSVPLR